MVFDVTHVTFRMTLMNKGTNIIKDDQILDEKSFGNCNIKSIMPQKFTRNDIIMLG